MNCNSIRLWYFESNRKNRQANRHDTASTGGSNYKKTMKNYKQERNAFVSIENSFGLVGPRVVRERNIKNTRGLGLYRIGGK